MDVRIRGKGNHFRFTVADRDIPVTKAAVTWDYEKFPNVAQAILELAVVGPIDLSVEADVVFVTLNGRRYRVIEEAPHEPQP